jgi:hypothetical protein
MRRLSTLDGVRVTAGVQGQGDATPQDGDGANLLEIAATNEFGSDDGRVPSRPWLRTSLDRHRAKWSRGAARVPAAMTAGGTGEQELRQLGVVMAGDVRETLLDGPWEPNAPMTIERKGSDQPLVDTGRLAQSQRAAVEIPGHAPMPVG